MIYPKGETVYQNLSTEYTDLPQLLSSLKTKNFSGIIEIDVGGKIGILFVIAGEVINAAHGVESDTPRMVGEEAVEKLLSLSTRSNGLVNVYEVPPVEVEFAAQPLFKPEEIFKDLNTDFVRIDQFIKKLQDEKLTGYIEITTRKDRVTGNLSLKGGDIIGLQVASATGETSFYEREAIPSFLEQFTRQGASFNVYRTKTFIGPAKTGPAVPGRKTSKFVSAPEVKETKPPEVDVVDFKENIFEPAEAFSRKEDIFETKPFEAKTVSKTPAFAEVEASDNSIPENGRSDFLGAVQRIFLKIERFLDGAAEKGMFQRTFKKACIEKSDVYHFLDPFEGLFNYQDKKIRLDNAVATEEFVTAIADCLSLTISYIKKDLPKNVVLPAGLKADVESAFKKYPEVANSKLTVF